MEDFLDGMASLLGQDADNIIGGRTELPGGGVKRNFGDNFWGRSQQELDDAFAKKRYKELGAKYDGLLGQVNEKPVQPGEDINSINRRLQEGTKVTKTSDTKEVQNLTYYSPQAREERRLAAQTRADLLRSQDRTLQFQMLQAQRENDRYYDRLDREDARLRREGYQSLGTGLAALAAAFTIV
jgi:hypothetical protein